MVYWLALQNLKFVFTASLLTCSNKGNMENKLLSLLIQIQFILVAFVKHNCNIANTHNYDEIKIYVVTGKLQLDLLCH